MLRNVPDTELATYDGTDTPDLIALSALVGEGFGYDSPYITTPRDAIDALAGWLGDDVIVDDVGRRCVTRAVARRLFTERAELEQRQRAALQRRDAEFEELAAANRAWGGVPADAIPDGVTPAAAMLQAAKDAEPRRTTPLHEALVGRHPRLSLAHRGRRVVSTDFERLVDRYGIALETRAIAERFSDMAMDNAQYLAAPRLKLLDKTRRIVRVQNAPPEARRQPPRILSYPRTDVMTGKSRYEPVGKYHDRPNERDIDYLVTHTAAGDEILELLTDEVEPTVVMRRYPSGAAGLATSFEE